MADIRETRFETTEGSFDLQVVDAGGEPRELYLRVEPGGVRVTVFHGTEHALIPLNESQGQELAHWLVERVGLPPGDEYRSGRLFSRRHNHNQVEG